MSSVNNYLLEPIAPGPWVDSYECCCGSQYKTFTSGITFKDGATLVRLHNQENGGGYRSRGPILWAMRVFKLNAWYLQHMFCGGTT